MVFHIEAKTCGTAELPVDSYYVEGIYRGGKTFDLLTGKFWATGPSFTVYFQ